MTDLPQTRQSLLIELSRRNDSAWSEFLDVYESAIVRFCISRGLQEADARDATQHVYAAIHAKIGSWDHDKSKGSFRAWLFRVARNVSVDVISARAKTAATGDSRVAELLSQLRDHRCPGNESSNLGPQQQSAAFQLEWKRSLFEWASIQVKGEVRPSTWSAFCLTAIEGRKADSVAEELGLSIGSVYTAKCRVVARIRNLIEEWEADQPSEDWHV